MSALHERLSVACPYTLAKGYLDAELRDLAATGRETTLRLHAAFPGAEFARDVLVSYAAGTDPRHFDQPWRVHWTPKGGGPYPDFDGQLTVRADYDYNAAILELEGEYRPPGGLAGAAFDLALGTRIASQTAHELLGEIAARMEAHYHRDEAAKT